MLSRIASFLSVRADERRPVFLVAVLFACIQAGQGMGDNAASALFLLRYGVNFLPYMYLFLGAFTFITTLAYSAALGRLDKGKFFSALIAIFIGLLMLERAAILFPFPLLYPILWLTVNGVSMILGTFVWNIAGEVCDARQAKRLFPLFTSAGILGSVIGNAVTGVSARLLGTDNLLLLYAVPHLLYIFLNYLPYLPFCNCTGFSDCHSSRVLHYLFHPSVALSGWATVYCCLQSHCILIYQPRRHLHRPHLLSYCY